MQFGREAGQSVLAPQATNESMPVRHCSWGWQLTVPPLRSGVSTTQHAMPIGQSPVCTGLRPGRTVWNGVS